ncbi:SRPBCC family protein [Streptomyces sp. NBC_00249]|uniref:SRPBCC family protein n=1 Tax=Streptomyces sp. NBC_00249 TaxID=2975690 RepID=UPI0022584F77|nr:SRPBCC family protein [Streptomyces sp. NBC_00249]MCX5199463.1 SRPBCC family protein [Streptomyces sp. NBC_00249]
MPAEKTYQVEEKALVSAPVDVVRRIVVDVEAWVQLHGPAVHAEILESGDHGELIRHWSVVDDHTVRTWDARREVTASGDVRFTHEPANAPFATVSGGFDFEEQPNGKTLVRMHHAFTLLEDDESVAAQRVESMQLGSRAYLNTLHYAAENADELERLIISFEDPLFVAGSVEDAYAYLYEADKWPDRIPHVLRLELEENTPNIQFFDMDTKSSDGSEHTTRSVRICLPNHKIVYKQTRPPKTMFAHTGHWLFTETPEGVVVSSRHTATIRPEGLHLLGEGMTVEGARKYLRRILSANSMGNLRLSKEYAEERAGH